MAKPWDLKLTCALSEHEMLDYVRLLEEQGKFFIEDDIQKQVERCVQEWRRMRERPQADTMHPQYMPVQFYRREPLRDWIGELDTMPVSEPMRPPIIVKVYPWMDERHVRYLARVQIEEQVGDDA